MKKLYRLFRRGRKYYCEHVETRKQTSLGTANETEALRLLAARNEADQRPTLNLALARTYMHAHDQKMIERTWEAVMAELCEHGKTSSKERAARAMKHVSFDFIRNRRIVETSAEDLLSILKGSCASTNHYLRRLHNLALGLGWLPWQILPPRLWPDVSKGKRRGITAEEHQKIVEAEKNIERKNFYWLLWELGASQSDAALLAAESIDWEKLVISYQRQKTGEWAHIMIGKRLEGLLKQLPTTGPLFPGISKTNASARSAEFCRRCRLLGLKGVSLHSYRYGWAERARASGYPQRWAQNALGHSSKAIHEAYAKGASAVCPSIEEYENH